MNRRDEIAEKVMLTLLHHEVVSAKYLKDKELIKGLVSASYALATAMEAERERLERLVPQRKKGTMTLEGFKRA